MTDSNFFNQEYFVGGTKSSFGLLSDYELIKRGLEFAGLTIQLSDGNPGKVLVSGCGRGDIIKALGSLNIDAHGHDISEWITQNSLPEAKSKISCCAMADLDAHYKPKSFDTVAIFGVLEHIDGSNVAKSIEQACLVAKQRILIRVPIWHNEKEVDQSGWSTDKSHVSIHTPEHWEQLFNNQGWKTKYRIIIDNNAVFGFVQEVRQERPLVWVGAPYDQSGYGEASRGYLKGLMELNADVILRSRRFWTGAPLELDEPLASKMREWESRPIPVDNFDVVMNVTPENYQYFDGVRKICAYTPFETDRVPARWVLPMRSLDCVFAASDFNVKTYAPFNIKAVVAPHGVDSDLYRPDGPKMQLGIPDDYYVFGTNFDWNPRKNPEKLLTSYWKAFGPDDKVVLYLKTFCGLHADDIKRHIEALKTRLKFDYYPRVVLDNKIIPINKMPSLYRAWNCMVSASRGEGFGLSISESLATALPVITTITGNTYCNDRNCLPIQGAWEWIPYNSEMHNFSPNYKSQKWFEADGESLANCLQKAYNNREAVKQLGLQGRKDMAPYTWKNVTRNIVNWLGGQ